MLAEIITKVSSTPFNGYPQDDRGWFARFFRIDDKFGAKFYKSEDMRDKTYILQDDAHKFGLAPAVGDIFDSVTHDGTKVYGYITEAVTETYDKRYGYEDAPEYAKSDYDFERLLDNLAEIMWINDIHTGNVGWLENGELVCIDFSHCEPGSGKGETFDDSSDSYDGSNDYDNSDW